MVQVKEFKSKRRDDIELQLNTWLISNHHKYEVLSIQYTGDKALVVYRPKNYDL